MTRALTQRVRRLERLLTPQGDPLDEITDADLVEMIRLLDILIAAADAGADMESQAILEAAERLQAIRDRYPRLVVPTAKHAHLSDDEIRARIRPADASPL